MSCILHIETSTDVCSVAVSNDGECIFNREDHDGPNHGVKLGVFGTRLFRSAMRREQVSTPWR